MKAHVLTNGFKLESSKYELETATTTSFHEPSAIPFQPDHKSWLYHIISQKGTYVKKYDKTNHFYTVFLACICITKRVSALLGHHQWYLFYIVYH
jgi:hypothetical protein